MVCIPDICLSGKITKQKILTFRSTFATKQVKLLAKLTEEVKFMPVRSSPSLKRDSRRTSQSGLAKDLDFRGLPIEERITDMQA